MTVRPFLFFIVLLLGTTAGGLLANTDLSRNAPGDGIPDGLCDVWQNHFEAWGLDPLADADGDGLSNLAESIAGTDPRKAGDGFRIASVGFDAGTIVFTFVAKQGKKYRVARSDAPGGGAWTPVPGSAFVAAQNHANHALVIPRPGAIASEFCRLEVQENDADGDGVSDWAEWRRGTDPETLTELQGEFALDPNERPIFADTFSGGTRFGRDRMIV